jgi:UDP-N-acetylglucosamine--N-acetylmuramyl-(pentapeptide) pyrophosphoryl-undecaprenol N-acetylglucosamine transferase
LNAESLAEVMSELLGDSGRLLAMAEKARSRAQPDAAERIAAACLEELSR